MKTNYDYSKFKYTIYYYRRTDVQKEVLYKNNQSNILVHQKKN